MSSGKGGKKASRAHSGKKGLAHPKPPKRKKTPAPKKAATKKKPTSKRGRTRLDLGGGNGMSALSRIARTVSKAAAGRDGGDEGN